MHGQAHKKKKILFILFIILLFLIYIERNHFFKELRSYLEEEISRQISFPFRIGNIEKWFGKRIILKQVSIMDREYNFLVSVEKIFLEFPSLDFWFNRKRLEYIKGEAKNVVFFTKGFKIPLKISYLDLIFQNGCLEIKNLKGFIWKDFLFELEANLGKINEGVSKIDLRCHFLHPLEKNLPFFVPQIICLRGDLEKILLEGYNEKGSVSIHFKGEIFPSKGNFNLVFLCTMGDNELSPIKIEGSFKDEDKFVKIIFDHFWFKNSEIISNINIKVKYNNLEKSLEGEVYSSSTLFDFFPFPEFEARYRFKDGILTIDEFKWTDSFTLTGKINFLENILGNLVLTINNFNLFYFAQLYYPGWNAWGGVSGKVDLNLRDKKVFAKGEILLSEGEFGPFKFKGGRIKFSGENNIFKIIDTRIYEDKGYFDINGEIDLKKLGKPELGKNLVFIPYQEKIDWQGWSISTRNFLSSVSIDKNIDDKFSIQIQPYIVEELKNFGLINETQKEIGLEYKLEEDRSLKLRLKDNEEVFGFERKIRF